MNRTLNISRSYESGLASNTWSPSSYNNAYYNAFTYDAMGNILTQQRHKRDGTKIEEMSYQYQYANGKLQRNRLYHINDGVASNMDATDIDDMGAFDPTVSAINQNNNYSYDEEGRLVKDVSEQISKITWRVDGKVKEIQRGADTSKRFIRFDYDAMGHRIAKHVYDNTGIVLKKSTYYILDAQGNQIAMYEHLTAAQTVQYNLIEKNIFGSARLGTKEEKTNMLTAAVSPFKYTRTLGWKKYEFSNHLGNVLAVFCDVKVPLDNNTDGTVDAYRVCLQNVTDYSPFGVTLDGRTMQGDGYRYGYQGSEYDNEIKGEGHSYTTEYRQLDTRLGRWLSIDPKMSAWESPYVSMGNNPLLFNDELGDTIKIFGGKGYVSPPHRTLYYVNGVVTDMNGQEYIKGGDFSNADNDKLIEDLEKIRTGGMEGARLIDFFSKNNVSVSPKGSGAEFLVNSNSINYPENYTPSIVIFTNDVASSPEVRNYRTFTDLAHEMYHAQRFIQGIHDYSPWNGTNAARDEIWATHGENKIRNENGLPLRTHYGHKEESPNVYKPGLSLFDEIKVKTIINFTYQGKHLMKEVLSTPYDYNNPQENREVTKSLDYEINNVIRAFSKF